MIFNFVSFIFFSCFLVQIIIDSSFENAVSSFICFVASILGLYLTFKLSRGPSLSSIALVGFQASYFWLPLVSQSVGLRSVTSNLSVPVDSFVIASIALFAIIPAYSFSAELSKNQTVRKYSFRLNTILKNNITLTKRSFYTIITLALFVRLVTTGLRVFGRLDFITKLIEPLSIFGALSFACLFITPASVYIRKYNIKSYPFFVFLLTILFTLPSLSRFNILIIVANTFILLAISLFNPQASIDSRKQASRFVINIILTVLLVFPVLDRIADATAYVRFSGSASGGPLQTAQKIVSAAISGERHNWESTYRGPYPWDDNYTNSTIFKRFISINYLDLSYRFHRIQDEDQRSLVRTFEFNRILALAPDPLINLFTPSFDKDTIIRSSFGDYNYYVVSGIGLGGFRTGNLLVSFMTLFGILWPFAFFFISTLVFFVFNLISYPPAYLLTIGMRSFYIGPITVCLMYEALTVFTSAAGGSESLSRVIGLFFRVIPFMAIYFSFFARRARYS